MNKKWLPYIAVLFVQLIYGSNYVVAKGIMPNVIGPTGLVFCRILGATALFWLCFSFNYERVERKDLIRLAICAFFGIFLNQVLFLNGLNLTSPINASLIMITLPISVFLLSIFFFKEKATKRKIIGLLLGTIGFAYMVVVSNKASRVSSWQGDAMIAVNAFSYGLYLVLIKTLMHKYKPLTVLSWVFLFGAILIIPFGWNQFSSVEWSMLPNHQLFSISYVVIVVTFIVYFLSIFALSKVSPTVIGTFTYTQPLAAAFFSWLYFVTLTSIGMESEDYTNEINASKIVSAILIFIGVYLVSFQPKKLNN